MKEMYKGMVNSPVAELSESISAQATVIKVSNINAFPEAPNLATIGTDENAETVKYNDKTESALSGCERGIEGTARTWQKGEKIARNFTNKDHTDLIENIKEVNSIASRAFQSASEGKKKIAGVLTGAEIFTPADWEWGKIEKNVRIAVGTKHKPLSSYSSRWVGGEGRVMEYEFGNSSYFTGLNLVLVSTTAADGEVKIECFRGENPAELVHSETINQVHYYQPGRQSTMTASYCKYNIHEFDSVRLTIDINTEIYQKMSGLTVFNA